MNITAVPNEKTRRREREVGVEKSAMEGGISCSPPCLPTSHNPPYVPKPQSTVHRPATMQRFSLSRIPRNVPFAIANGLTAYYSWVTLHPVIPRVPLYLDISYIEHPPMVFQRSLGVDAVGIGKLTSDRLPLKPISNNRNY